MVRYMLPSVLIVLCIVGFSITVPRVSTLGTGNAGENTGNATDCSKNTDCGPAEYCMKETGGCDDLGTCATKPNTCQDIWDPVCGCDGETYTNYCFAAQAGMSVDYEGECSEGCIDNNDCQGGEYCTKTTGNCDETGACADIPASCLPVWDPVCGCDGVTYSNACYAALAGENVDYDGECAAASCSLNVDCGQDEYCAKATGDCEGQGSCQPMPGVCPDIVDPVCGCDGITYSNECLAAMAGVNVEFEGECGLFYCRGNRECDLGEYCSKAVGDCNGRGTCNLKPTICPTLHDPVCGCDGRTYINACIAAMLGMNIAYEGECSVSCSKNNDCSPEEYCEKVTGNCTGNGRCQPKPTLCPPLWDPVCGCDGRTYSNECEAALSGVNIDYIGECAIACSTIGDCPSGNYCEKETGDCSGQGVCEPRPQGCPDVWDPVCGCNGRTYSNACEAAAVGVNVDYEGECQSQQARGDVNGDDSIDLFDLLEIVNHILGTEILTGDSLWAADCNADAVIDLFDLINIVNVILGTDSCEP